VEITGPDAFTLANMLVPRDLNKCAVGQCKYVFITDSQYRRFAYARPLALGRLDLRPATWVQKVATGQQQCRSALKRPERCRPRRPRKRCGCLRDGAWGA
jgi:hypothetical protein